MSNRNRILKVRVTDDEYKTIMENCIKSGRTISELLREAACEKDIVVLDELGELVKELRYHGNNLNQLTVMARQNRISFVNQTELAEVYEKIWQTLNSLLSHVV